MDRYDHFEYSQWDPTLQIDLPMGMSLKHHPCPYSDDIMDVYRMFLVERFDQGRPKVLDPMAGIGKMHDLGDIAQVTTNELEPEFAYHHPATLVGDAADLPFADEFFDCVFFSPPYANRLGDRYHPKGEQAKGRKSYVISLDRQMLEGSTSTLQWTDKGTPYQELSRRILGESCRLLRPGGFIGINVKGHYRDKKLMDVSGWYEQVLLKEFGFEYEWGVELDQDGWTFSPHRDRDLEKVLFFRKPSDA